MFQNKVYDQKVELLRAVFRNMYLKEKCDYLDSECRMLAEHLLSSQVTRAEVNEEKIKSEKEWNDLRELHEKHTQGLSLAKEKLMSLSMSLENTQSSILNSSLENKSINEELELRNEMIKCLQEELVHVRLEAAEKWVLLRELKQVKDELVKEKESMVKSKPETISRLQEELMEAKLLETQYSLEFNKIRKQLEQIKSVLNSHEDNGNANGIKLKLEGNVNISKKGVLWRNRSQNSTEIEDINDEIKKMEREKLYLQNKIPLLKDKIEILNKHIQFKEAEKCKFQEKLNSIRLKHQSIENITLERKRQCEHLKNSALEKVHVIRDSSIKKNENIDELYSKLQEISKRRESYSSTFMLKEASTIQALEEQILILENRISQLKIETMNHNKEN